MDAFEQFWQLYPRRDGENPKHPARVVFERLLKKGISLETILDAVEKFRMQMQIKHMIDTPFIPHARTWLNQHRFEGYGKAKQASRSDDEIAKLEAKYREKRIREGWH